MIRDNYTNGFRQFADNDQIHLASQDSQMQGFTPTATDVICGRGKNVFEHEGNINFRGIVTARLPEYKAAVSKTQKSAVVSSVFDEVTIDGFFIKQNPQTERWYVVAEAAAREKISQCFRDCLDDKFESSKSCKTTKKRKQARESDKVAKAPERSDSQPALLKRSKLFRSSTAPASTQACSSKDAFQQLVMFSQSVMPPFRRSNPLRVSNSSSCQEDMEPLPFEPLAFPSMAMFPDLEPTPLPFTGSSGQGSISPM